MSDITTQEALALCPFCGIAMVGDSDYWVHMRNDCILSEYEFDGHRDGLPIGTVAWQWNRRAALDIPAHPVSIDVDRMHASLDSWAIQVPPGLNREEKRDFILAATEVHPVSDVPPELKTWPERIYLDGGESQIEEYPGINEDLHWADIRNFGGDVEYVRADLAAAPSLPVAERQVPDMDAIYAAWLAVGTDLRGLDWRDFVREYESAKIRTFDRRATFS